MINYLERKFNENGELNKLDNKLRKKLKKLSKHNFNIQ